MARRRSWSFLIALLALCAASPAQEAERKRSVIFVIGDGMGVSQLTLGRLGAQRMGRTSQFDRFPVTGLASTRSHDNTVTDSAAAGTALACGVKTLNWTIGLDPDGRPLVTILDVAHQAGYRTGVLTTTRITHATPAAFTAHVWHREEEQAIADQQAEQGYPEVFVGGGGRYFGERHQARLKANGYEVVGDPAAVMAAKGPKLAGFLAPSHYPYAIDRAPGTPDLAALMGKAVELLSAGGQPFVLMVEAGRVDHAGHDHDAAALMHEMLDTEGAVGWALDYQRAHPETLVVVTADHATGALGISEDVQVAALLQATSSVEALQKSLPASAPEDRLKTLQVQVYRHHLELELPLDELALTEAHPDKYWWVMRLGHSISLRRGVSFYDPEWQQEQLGGTHGHDGAFVPVFAAGPGAEAFAGIYENERVVLRIAEALGLPAPGGRLEPSPVGADRGK